MKYKTLGNTQVPAIGQGTGGVHDADIIRRGIDYGMTFIDTAESYKNEDIVGEAIRGIRDKVFIATKFSPQHSGYKDVLSACEGSLKRLGTDYIDLYQLHWQNHAVPLSETIEAMSVLLKDKVRYFGVCNMIPDFPVSSIQTEYNLFDRSAEADVIPYCEKNNLITIAYSPLNHFYEMNPEKMLWLEEIAYKHEKTMVQIALNWLTSRKLVIAIPKSHKPEHIKDNATATDFTLSEDEIKYIDNLFAFEISYLDPKIIRITKAGKFPQTLEEAQRNIYNFCPSPVEMAKGLIDIKPVRVEKVNNNLELIEGGLRYWAWVMKYGDKPIPTLILERNVW